MAYCPKLLVSRHLLRALEFVEDQMNSSALRDASIRRS